MADIYISPFGSDSAAGTRAAPLATVTRVLGSKTITAITNTTGTQYEFTVSQNPCAIKTGMYVAITRCRPDTYNGVYQVISTSAANKFTVDLGSAPGTLVYKGKACLVAPGNRIFLDRSGTWSTRPYIDASGYGSPSAPVIIGPYGDYVTQPKIVTNLTGSLGDIWHIEGATDGIINAVWSNPGSVKQVTFTTLSNTVYVTGAASSNGGAHTTFTVSSSAPLCGPGRFDCDTVTIAGASVSGYNGTWDFVSSTGGSATSGTVTVAVPYTANISNTGTTCSVKSNHRLAKGMYVNVTKVVPTAYNGTWLVDSATDNTVTIKSGVPASNPGAMTQAGRIAQSKNIKVVDIDAKNDLPAGWLAGKWPKVQGAYGVDDGFVYVRSISIWNLLGDDISLIGCKGSGGHKGCAIGSSAHNAQVINCDFSFNSAVQEWGPNSDDEWTVSAIAKTGTGPYTLEITQGTTNGASAISTGCTASTTTFTKTGGGAHNFTNDMPVRIASIASGWSGLSTSTLYFVELIDSTSFKLKTHPNNTSFVSVGSSGSGTITQSHGYNPNDRITIFGASPSAFNVTGASVVSCTATKMTISVTSDPGTYSSGGKIYGMRSWDTDDQLGGWGILIARAENVSIEGNSLFNNRSGALKMTDVGVRAGGLDSVSGSNKIMSNGAEAYGTENMSVRWNRSNDRTFSELGSNNRFPSSVTQPVQTSNGDITLGYLIEITTDTSNGINAGDVVQIEDFGDLTGEWVVLSRVISTKFQIWSSTALSLPELDGTPSGYSATSMIVKLQRDATYDGNVHITSSDTTESHFLTTRGNNSTNHTDGAFGPCIGTTVRNNIIVNGSGVNASSIAASGGHQSNYTWLEDNLIISGYYAISTDNYSAVVGQGNLIYGNLGNVSSGSPPSAMLLSEQLGQSLIASADNLKRCEAMARRILAKYKVF